LIVQHFQPYKALLAVILCVGISEHGYAPNVYWKTWSIDSSGNGADGVSIGDFNQDGLVDVVSG
jgi:hypothetical protein